MNEVINAVMTYFSGFWGMVELVATAFSLICVWLATKHNQLTWLTGAIGVILMGALFYEFKLYSDAGLQILFYLPVQLWGYLTWKKLSLDTDNESVTLSLQKKTIPIIALSIFALSAVNGYVMATYTDASFPYIDAWTTWMSIFAQILMVKKYWESWVLWISMDAVAIFVYAAKGLYVVSGLYVLFFIMATVGLFRWLADYNSQKEPFYV